MIEFHVLTIFPELIASFAGVSLIGRAARSGLLAVRPIDLRGFTGDKHRTVDDTPYGGGTGMVMKPEPVLEALDALPDSHRVLLTPQGRRFDQALARRLAEAPSIAMLCGRYEGFDERIRAGFDEEISLGDFVLNGGEVAAMAVIETVSRLVPGVVGNSASPIEESFSEGLLEYPQYTRPEIVRGMSVPPVLLSGDHARIASWRRGRALLRTRERRPDLFARLELDEEDRELLAEAERES
ncbi:MAG: tRNA (guanosine(37)-N1)-methyltransferase TrmD [Polyangia bacterium]